MSLLPLSSSCVSIPSIIYSNFFGFSRSKLENNMKLADCRKIIFHWKILLLEDSKKWG
jgi:hypothetical protein